MHANKPKPGQPFPMVVVPQVGGGSLELGARSSQGNWKLLVVYRGRHCPICTRYLNELNAIVPALPMWQTETRPSKAAQPVWRTKRQRPFLTVGPISQTPTCRSVSSKVLRWPNPIWKPSMAGTKPATPITQLCSRLRKRSPDSGAPLRCAPRSNIRSLRQARTTVGSRRS